MMSEHARFCINIRVGNILYSAEAGISAARQANAGEWGQLRVRSAVLRTCGRRLCLRAASADLDPGCDWSCPRRPCHLVALDESRRRGWERVRQARAALPA